jgi:hypothetical protein
MEFLPSISSVEPDMIQKRLKEMQKVLSERRLPDTRTFALDQPNHNNAS